jgi:hypothetical protein
MAYSRSYFTVDPAGQTLFLTSVKSGADTRKVYTSSALTSEVTLPDTITASTSYYLDLGGASAEGLTVVIGQHDGTQMVQQLNIIEGSPVTILPVPTVPQVAADLSTASRAALADDEYLRQGSPAGLYAEAYPARTASGNTAIAASGVEISVGVPLHVGDVVTNVTFVTATTAAVAPTAGYAVLRDPTGAKLAQTADFGSTARAANTVYTVALTAPYTVLTSGLYYVGLSFTVTTTVPTVHGFSFANAVMAGATLSRPVLAKTHGSAVGAVAPDTIATPTTVATVPWVALS